MKKISLIIFFAFAAFVAFSQSDNPSYYQGTSFLKILRQPGGDYFLRAGADKTLPFSNGTTISYRAIAAGDLPDLPQYQDTLRFRDENVTLGTVGTVTNIDFVGAGVTATRASNSLTVTIPAATGTPGGSTTQVQYNNAGAFAGDADFTFDGTNVSVANPLYVASGSVTAPSIAPTGDANTGIYFASTDYVNIATNGKNRLAINQDGEAALVSTGTGVSTPVLKLRYDKTTTATDDDEITIPMNLDDGAGNETTFGRLRTISTNVADTLEEGQIAVDVIGDGTMANKMNVTSAEVNTTVPVKTGQYTATAASALTPVSGWIIYTTSTDTTFTSIGYWAYENGAWTALGSTLTGRDTLDFPSTNSFEASELTITVTGAAEGDEVALGIVNAVSLTGAIWTAWVSATDTVTVQYYNGSGVGAGNPSSQTFKVRVFK